MVRAKFTVTGIERIASHVAKKDENGELVKNTYGSYETEPREMRTVKMSPVYGNGDPNHENTKFWASSPSGHLEIGCANLEAAEAFELGKEYYVDFTLAE